MLVQDAYRVWRRNIHAQDGTFRHVCVGPTLGIQNDNKRMRSNNDMWRCWIFIREAAEDRPTAAPALHVWCTPCAVYTNRRGAADEAAEEAEGRGARSRSFRGSREGLEGV